MIHSRLPRPSIQTNQQPKLHKLPLHPISQGRWPSGRGRPTTKPSPSRQSRPKPPSSTPRSIERPDKKTNDPSAGLSVRPNIPRRLHLDCGEVKYSALRATTGSTTRDIGHRRGRTLLAFWHTSFLSLLPSSFLLFSCHPTRTCAPATSEPPPPPCFNSTYGRHRRRVIDSMLDATTEVLNTLRQLVTSSSDQGKHRQSPIWIDTRKKTPLTTARSLLSDARPQATP